jgi:hypothetical protein
MKKIIIGIAMTVCFTLGFATWGIGKHASSGLMAGMTVEKAFASESPSHAMALDNQAAPKASNFSWPTLLCLYTGMIVIVSVRRNGCA